MYDPEQVIRCRLSAYRNHATSDDPKNDSRGKVVINNYDVCTASRLGLYEERQIGDAEPATDIRNANIDDRPITTEQTPQLINGLENLTSKQKQKLTAILMKHQKNFTRKPSMCSVFEYAFRVQGQLPRSTYSRSLPFDLRPALNEEIRQLLKDHILEESHSEYLNPLR
jgi:hypothetical protein